MALAANITAKIQWLSIESSATAGATGDLKIIRRTAADTGGTPANATLGQANNTDAAPAIQPIHFTAHPTALGAAATNPNILAYRFTQPAAGGANPATGRFIDFAASTFGAKYPVVIGATDFLCINAAAALGGAGNGWDITWCWTEQGT